MRAAFLSLALPLAALAQTSVLTGGDLSRGVTLPPTGAALADEATATELNPAALTFVGDPQLFYVHDRDIAQGLTGDGLFAGAKVAAVGLGVSAQWLRGPLIPSYRKITGALSLGRQELSVGVALNSFSSEPGADLNAFSSVDLGLAARPVKFLSLGAVVKNVDAPSHGAVSFERRYDLGLGLRPIGDRYTLGVDYLWGDTGGPGEGRLSYALNAEVLRGLVIGAGFSHGFRSSDDMLFQLSATLNGPRFGLTYAVGASSAGLDHVIAARLSAESYRAITLGDGKIALFDLADMLSQNNTLSFLGFGGEDPFLKTIHTLDQASRDGRLRAVVLKIDNLPGGLAHMDELRDAVVRLRTSGKRVVAVMLNAGDKEYLLATAADALYAVPQAALEINGFSANVTFLGGAMDKLGVDFNVARVGPFKNAPDTFTRSEMSDEQREAINAYLDADVKHNDEAIAQSRQLKPQKLHDAWKEGVLTPQRAWELGVVDEIVNPEELQDKLEGLVPGARYDPRYDPFDLRETRWGPRKQIAIVPVIGTIAGGKGGEDPLGLQKSAGADAIIRAIKDAQEDADVAAIVLRVDSPGGDGLASDLIYRAVLEAKKKKPVIASMGDVAASGGYYVAMGADEIWAEPTTITGSIGVFVLLPAWARLGDKLGVKEESIRRGDLADMFGTYHVWSEDEQQAAQRYVNAFYDDFVGEVSRNRKLDKNAVDAIARGRVWAGSDAKLKGLVDNLGSLIEAVEAARTKANIAPNEDVEIEVETGREGVAGLVGAKTRARLVSWFGKPEPSPLPEGLKRLAASLGFTDAALANPGIKAQLPYSLTVR